MFSSLLFLLFFHIAQLSFKFCINSVFFLYIFYARKKRLHTINLPPMYSPFQALFHIFLVSCIKLFKKIFCAISLHVKLLQQSHTNCFHLCLRAIFFHNFGNSIVRWSINTLFKSDIKDIMTGYRAFYND